MAKNSSLLHSSRRQTKKESRLRRSRKSRIRMGGDSQLRPRLTVHRSCQHIYAQIVRAAVGASSQVLVSASTLDKELRSHIKGTKTEKARLVGSNLAKRAKAAGIGMVAFDRSGFKYHGRVKALAEAAREGGLDF